MSKKHQQFYRKALNDVRHAGTLNNGGPDLPSNKADVTRNEVKTGVGKGHGGNTPNLPVIRLQDTPPQFKTEQRSGLLQPYLRIYKMGKCLIMVGWNDPDGWHLSISRPDRYPGWDEIAKARYELLPAEIHVGMMLPPPDEYVNVHNYCFHLHELPPQWRDDRNKVSMSAPPELD